MGKGKVVSKGAVKAAAHHDTKLSSTVDSASSKQQEQQPAATNYKETKKRLLNIQPIITKALWQRVKNESEEVITTLSKWFPVSEFPDFIPVKCQMCGVVYDERNNRDGACTVEHDLDNWDCGDIVGMDGYEKIYSYTASCSKCGESFESEGGMEIECDQGYCWQGRHISDPKEAKRIFKELRDNNDYGYDDYNSSDDESDSSDNEDEDEDEDT